MRIAHIITRMIVGGAQENTLLNCLDLRQIYGDDLLLITGPAIGPEGDLLRQRRGGEVPLAYVPSLRRTIHPWRDVASYRHIKRILREFKPNVVHTHSAKGGFLGRLAASALKVECPSANPFSLVRMVRRPPLPRHHQRRRRHDRIDGAGQGRAPREVHDDL